MIKRLSTYFVLYLVSSTAFGQYPTKRSRSEVGIIGGGMTYIGDLNPYTPFKHTNLAFGGVYRYNINPRLAFRANAIYGNVQGYDADATAESMQLERNLSFQSEIYEVSGGIELYYLPFQIGHHKHFSTAYILVEFGGFHMNPVTDYQGESIELRSLGTEGQGTSLSDKDYYSLNQLVLPLGMGWKLSVGKRFTFNVEAGIRKTFTDYLDDVSSDHYVDYQTLAAENGPLAAELSNRSLSGSRYGKRGDSSTKDWYIFSGMMITFRLGMPKNCQN